MNDSSSAGYVIGIIIAGLIAIWVGTDANKRGMNGIGWGIGVFLLCIVFLPIYLIVRKPIQAKQPYGYPQGPQPPQPYGYQPPAPPQPPQQGYVPPQQSYTPPPPAAPPQTPPPAPDVGRHFCSSCGSQLASGAKFCPSCGRAV